MSAPIEMFEMPGRAGLTLREAGDMGPSSERDYPSRDIVAAAGLLVLPQTHSSVVHSVDSSWIHRKKLPEGDGMVTDDPSVVLSVTVADCLPIYLANHDAGVRAIVHSGWRGTGIAAVAVDVLARRFSVAPSEIVACIGPGICGRCYGVGTEIYDRFLHQYGPTAARIERGRPHVDLAAANEVLLRRNGVSDVRRIDHCTYESERYASYRRDGVGFGRMLAFFGPAE